MDDDTKQRVQDHPVVSHENMSDSDRIMSNGGVSTDNYDEEDESEDDDIDLATLRHYADCACKKIHIGTAIMPAPLFQADAEDYPNEEWKDAVDSLPSTPYARIVHQEFNAVVIEHHLKWGPLCGEASGNIVLGKYDFELVDQMVDWACSHNLQVKGHVLVWAVTSPPILKELTPEQVKEHVKRHIFTVMNHFRDRIRIWDVVNEPLAPDGSLAHNVFVEKLGIDYVAQCFQWAHEADPNAHLILNENKVEGIGSPKSERFYELVQDLLKRGIPVHGIGLQAHFNAAGTGRNRPPTPYQVKRQIHRLGQLGLSVNLSELDVRVSQLPSEHRTEAQSSIYHDLVAAALSEPACDGIWLWGFSDRHTWVTHFYYDDEPCVTDEDYQRKPCYYALREALQSCTVGGMVGGGPRLDPILLDSNVSASGQTWGEAWIAPEPTTDGTLLLEPDHHARQDSALFRGDARPDWEQQLDVKELDSGEPLDEQHFPTDFASSDDGEDEDGDDVDEGDDDNEDLVDVGGIQEIVPAENVESTSGGNVDFLS